VDLRCGDVSLYTGKMGRKGDRMAVRISDRHIDELKD
ncbi:MAG: hypothetical protein HOF84_04115, partial [Rhodospirillales bacterium]|nr:hypothetical protein [Rhodospirillales bacterium]